MSHTLVAPQPLQRELGSYDAGRQGPTLLICGGIHGNEPAGVHAARRFLAALREQALPIAGRVEAIAGNLGALAQRQRFLVRDLNRGWGDERLAGLRGLGHERAAAEDLEQRGMLAVFERADAHRRGPLVFVDLHTSSGEGAPFTCTGDTLPNRRLAMSLPLPLILGLEETIEGAVLEWFNMRGHAALAIEGGQHDRPESVDNHEASLWLLLVATGMLPAARVPNLETWRARLRASARGAPPVVEIRYRHVIGPSDGFRMRPGFKTFQAVARGEQLGTSADGEVRSPEGGRVLLPLYQPQGEDGFFLGRDVRPFWLGVARWARKLRLDRAVRLLPGVRRAKDDPHTLLASQRVARWYLVEVFHLLGFRKQRKHGEVLVFSRRFANDQALSLPWRG
ncbi:MAG: succinylglutamate desuccinylase/aspartoacylase family protein [Planctomycetota bacterium]